MLISPTMWKQTIKHFTLMELVVVIVIIAVTASLAISTFRGDSPSVKLDKAALNFQLFCAQVRYKAIEEAADKIISYDSSKKYFVVETSTDDDSSELQTSSIDENLFWELPEDFQLSSDFTSLVEAEEDGKLEMFRFFANGTATSPVKFVLTYKKLQRRFLVSPLTGLISFTELETSDEGL